MPPPLPPVDRESDVVSHIWSGYCEVHYLDEMVETSGLVDCSGVCILWHPQLQWPTNTVRLVDIQITLENQADKHQVNEALFIKDNAPALNLYLLNTD